MNKGAFSTDESDYVISESTWKWTYFVLKALEKSLSVNVALHGDHQLLESGQIFLFNHFSRFETFIPQYLIYRQTGCYSRSIAGAEFFKGDTALSSYLRAVGAVPNRHPRLLPFLAEEILKGRKVIIFPEGGMVKDRQVIDQKGDYSVYSRSADRRRKHHSGWFCALVGGNLFSRFLGYFPGRCLFWGRLLDCFPGRCLFWGRLLACLLSYLQDRCLCWGCLRSVLLR